MSTAQNMKRDHHTIWAVWADRLHHWGLGTFAAALLESTGPLKLLGAQFVYMGQPTLNGLLPDEHLSAFATLLENDVYSDHFIKILREEEA